MNLTAKQLAHAIGLQAGYPINGLTVLVRVVDAKSSYGVPRLLIEPVAGSGRAWVNAESIHTLID